MKVIFQDLEDRDNPRNGETFASVSQVVDLLDELRCSRPPFMCELIGDNGFTLTVGLGGEIGCVQHAPSDGTPPYLMAVDSTKVEPNAGDMEFVVGGTATPIDRRYCLPFQSVNQIVAYFTETGDRSPAVSWEEF
jgi:Immunity protein Imm1